MKTFLSFEMISSAEGKILYLKKKRFQLCDYVAPSGFKRSKKLQNLIPTVMTFEDLFNDSGLMTSL